MDLSIASCRRLAPEGARTGKCGSKTPGSDGLLQTVRDVPLLKTAERAIMAVHWPDSGGNVGTDNSNAFATIREANGEGKRA
jgi:hypothetical protein